MIKYISEIYRKLIHLSSLWIPVLYLFSNQEVMIIVLCPLVAISLLIDIGRKFSPALNKLVNLVIGNLMRDNEKNASSLAGATYLFLGAIITIIFFKKEVAIFSLTVLVISDTFAALIGRKYGKIKIFGKSLEGSLSFFSSAIFIYIFYYIFLGFELSFAKVIFASLVGTIIELIAKKINLDDNFIIPIAISLAASF